MQRNQLIFGLIIAAALILIGAGAAANLIGGALSDSGGAEVENQATAIPKDAILVLVQSANAKEPWIEAMEVQFNATNTTLADGRRVIVQVEHTGSGLEPDLEPALWSPANEVWINEQNITWRDLNGRPLVSEATCPESINNPVGVAMWKPMAEAIGWPDEAIRWGDITALATNPNGWADYGMPQWGVFRYGHGHPEYSNSGRLSIVAQIYAAKGNNEPLTYEDIWSEDTQAALRPIQGAIAHYGRRDTFLLDRMVERGPAYLHAVTNYESNVIRWNLDYADRLQFPLVLVYPVDGTFWEGHPLCLVDGAPWISPEELEGARLFRDFITAQTQQAQLPAYGLRPALAGLPLDSSNSLITAANGAVPSINRDSMPLLPYPEAELMTGAVEMWYQVKKPATVVLVIDVSGSMYGEPMSQAMAGAQGFLDEMQAQDSVYIYVFNDQVFELGGGTVGEVREDLRRQVGSLVADGGTALHASVIQALDTVDALQAVDLAAGDLRTYSIVLLSDGANSSADGVTESQMLARLPDGAESDQAHIYTIAYGEAANIEVLTRIAKRTNGRLFTSSPENIADIYFQISSEF
jgi:Ca-activated chloride channel family protein